MSRTRTLLRPTSAAALLVALAALPGCGGAGGGGKGEFAQEFEKPAAAPAPAGDAAPAVEAFDPRERRKQD